MAQEKIIRDSEGKIINIGEWDYQYRNLYADDLEKPVRNHTVFLFDEEGNPLEPPVIGYVQKLVGVVPDNPLPEGSTESFEEVITGADGGRYHHSEYQKLRKLEYPSFGDQLDALFRAGVFPPELAIQIQAVKDKYPKVKASS